MRRELSLIAETLVSDHLAHAYGLALAEEGTARALARLHQRLWSMTLDRRLHAAVQCARELRKLAALAGIGADEIERIDADLLVEVMTVGVGRFHGSRRASLDFGAVMIEVSRDLVKVQDGKAPPVVRAPPMRRAG